MKRRKTPSLVLNRNRQHGGSAIRAAALLYVICRADKTSTLRTAAPATTNTETPGNRVKPQDAACRLQRPRIRNRLPAMREGPAMSAGRGAAESRSTATGPPQDRWRDVAATFPPTSSWPSRHHPYRRKSQPPNLRRWGRRGRCNGIFRRTETGFAASAR